MAHANYTVTVHTSTETTGDSVFTGTVPNTVTLEVWNQSQTIMISSQSVTLLTLLTPVTGTVTGLTQDETYYVRIVDNAGVPCPWQSYLVPGGPCDPPVLDSVTVTPNVS